MSSGRATTSADVAKQAGVSRATVSVVLNGTHSNIRVSDETRSRVLAAAAELDYTPHPAAQALRRQRSGTIGFVPRAFVGVPFEQPIPYLLGLFIARAALRRDLRILEIPAEGEASRGTDELVRFLLGRRVDGVILHAPSTVHEVRRVVDRGLPVVQLLRPQFDARTPAITVDPVPGIDAAVAHLIAQGHRRIAFIGSAAAHPVDRTRVERFRTALAAHGIVPHDGLMCLVDDLSIAAGHASTQALLALEERPTAIFAAADSSAIGALQALHEARLRVPDDISLISYDDAFAPYLCPPLTAVAQPLERVAEEALGLLVEGFDGARPPQIVLPSELRPRASVQPPRSGG